MAISLEEIEKALTALPQDKLSEFRAWYSEFDAKVWDVELKRDVAAGKLDALANRAIRDHRVGKSREL